MCTVVGLFGAESGKKLRRNKGSDTEPTFEHDWIELSIGAITGPLKANRQL
jgi:hypothetical protein